MHAQAVIEMQARISEKKEGLVHRLAALADIEDVDQRLQVDVPGTIRLYDPAAYELFQEEKRAEVMEQSLEVLESRKEEPAPKKRGRPRKNPEE